MLKKYLMGKLFLTLLLIPVNGDSQIDSNERTAMWWYMDHIKEIQAQENAIRIAQQTVERQSWQQERWDFAHHLLAKQTSLIYALQAQIKLYEEQNITDYQLNASVNKLLKEIEDGAKKQRKINNRKF